jgi:uncharacterized membrane protein YfcA
MLPVLYLLTGVAAGILSGLFGIGGGIIIVVSLATAGGLPFRTATGTSLAALLLPVSIGAAYKYWQAGDVNIPAAALVAGGLAVGAYFGARFALSTPPATLQRAFAIFLVLMAVRMWFKAA